MKNPNGRNGMQKKCLATEGECKILAKACGDATKKAKNYVDLNLMREIKDSKKGSFKYVSSKRKTKKNVGLLPTCG